MADYSNRRRAAVGQIQGQTDAQQRFLEMIMARVEAEDAERTKEVADEERATKLNWFDDASKGAQMGAAFGPWGALAGGVLGTAKGQLESYKERGGGGKAFFQTIFDTPFGFNLAGGKSHGSLGGGTMENMIGAAGTAYATKQRQDALKSPAAGAQDRERLRQRELAARGGPASPAQIQPRMDMQRPVSDENVGYSTRPYYDFYFG